MRTYERLRALVAVALVVTQRPAPPLPSIDWSVPGPVAVAAVLGRTVEELETVHGRPERRRDLGVQIGRWLYAMRLVARIESRDSAAVLLGGDWTRDRVARMELGRPGVLPGHYQAAYNLYHRWITHHYDPTFLQSLPELVGILEAFRRAGQ